ncbi:MAG: hypothetical protein H0T49_07255, partial [Chloroflexia bacterium]|nr:hypothetical protein [Chloroflexia bacterium]
MRLVRTALRDLPSGIRFMLDNVEVVVVDEPSSADLDDSGTETLEDVFGLYQGIP